MLNEIYYFLKPFIPWSVRLALRRQRAKSRLARYAGTWPIDPKSGVLPPGWQGWPGGKQFAFVLTHDVEGAKGLSRVEQVTALERRIGFRSSFNFVPEGEYDLSADLRERMTVQGFEVGVHGLQHDGKLYASKEEFAEKAAQIRNFLREWKACGFRSPLMQHKLAWLHQLGVEYDASTL